MTRIRCSIACVVVVLALAGGSACADGTGGGTPAMSASAHPAVTTAPPSPAPASGSPRPAPAGGVTIALGAPRYAVGENITVTVGNGLGEPVYAEDFQTECTIVTLQKSDGVSWTDITGCSLGRPTRTVKLEPGTTDEILLDPHSFHLAEGSGELGFGAGTYQIKFGYRLTPEPMGAEPNVAYSATFTIG
jgi:hypothetical protein